MNENQPNTDISGIQSQAEELIKAAFNRGLKQGRYEMHLQNSAHKEEFQRVYEEAEKLRADNAYIAAKFANYLVNTTGGRISDPFLDNDEIQKVFDEVFEEEVNKRVAAETKKTLAFPLTIMRSTSFQLIIVWRMMNHEPDTRIPV